MLLRQKLMRFELPFRITKVLKVSSDSRYGLVIGKDPLLELVSGRHVHILSLEDEDLEASPCSVSEVLRGPSAVYFVQRSRFGGSLRLCWRSSNCSLCEDITDIRVLDWNESFDSFYLVYKKGSEYYVIIDDLVGFTMTRLSNTRPQRILFDNGVLIAQFKSYTRIVSPRTGVFDIALTEHVEPLGIDTSTGSVIMYSKDSSLVFSLSRSNGFEPLGNCSEIVTIRNINGDSIVLCDFDVINGSFFPFYAGKIFVDLFKETENFNIIDPYIISFVATSNGEKHLVIARITWSPLYMRVIYSDSRPIYSVIANTSIIRIGDSIIERLEKNYGPLSDSDNNRIITASVYEPYQGRLCFGELCGKCIVQLELESSLQADNDMDTLSIRIGDRIIRPGKTYSNGALFFLDNDECSVLYEKDSLRICISEECWNISNLYHNKVGAQLRCRPKRFSDVDKILVECKAYGDFKRLVEYGSCQLSSNNVIRFQISEGEHCEVGIVDANGYVARVKKSYTDFYEELKEKLGRLKSLNIAKIGQGYALIEIKYSSYGLIPISVNDLFEEIEAQHIVLRLSGKKRIRIRDQVGLHEYLVDMPTRNRPRVTILRASTIGIDCSSDSCTLFCNKFAVSGRNIALSADMLTSSTECSLVVVDKGYTEVININPILEAVRAGAVAAKELFKLIEL